jgi:hypothetical protein
VELDAKLFCHIIASLYYSVSCFRVFIHESVSDVLVYDGDTVLDIDSKVLGSCGGDYIYL